MNDGRPEPSPVVAFVMEQHLGHRTYYENLRDHVDETVDARWVPIDYEVSGHFERLPLPRSLKIAAHTRSAVRSGIRGTDVSVFNTQVPAVLGGMGRRSHPFIVITDVTPKQYDAMAGGYGHRVDRPGPAAWTKHRLNLRTLQNARYCVGWSTWVRDSYVNDYAVPVERTRVIPPGVDTMRWTPGPTRDDGCFRVLFVGGDFDRKGGPELLQAFGMIDGPKELVLVTRSEIAPTEHVRVVRDLSPNDPRLIELYRSSDVFALPSRAETFGIVAAEAAACGLPVIASRTGGLSTIVTDGQTGFTIDVGDVGRLTERLRLLHNVSVRTAMGARARAFAVRELDARTNAHRLLTLIRETAGDRTFNIE